MNWNDFRKLHPYLPKASDGYHQHENGGGWVQDTAHVHPHAMVGNKALVYGIARVYGEAQIFGKAQVYEEAQVYGKAVVYDEAQIYGKAQVSGKAEVCGEARIYGRARVYGDAQIYDKVRIYGDAQVCGGEIDRTPILILGSQYQIGFSRPGYIVSGCIENPIEWWLENVERCAEEHGYTKAEQKEYRLHVEHIVAWMKLYGLDSSITQHKL